MEGHDGHEEMTRGTRGEAICQVALCVGGTLALQNAQVVRVEDKHVLLRVRWFCVAQFLAQSHDSLELRIVFVGLRGRDSKPFCCNLSGQHQKRLLAENRGCKAHFYHPQSFATRLFCGFSSSAQSRPSSTWKEGRRGREASVLQRLRAVVDNDIFQHGK
jgi:hypothetical protein